MSAHTPAGWYDDPESPGSGRVRYWDGSTWTSHTQDPVQAPTVTASPQAQASQGRRAAIIAAVVGGSMALVLVLTGLGVWALVSRTSNSDWTLTEPTAEPFSASGLPLCGTAEVVSTPGTDITTLPSAEPVCEDATTGYLYTAPVLDSTQRDAALTFPATISHFSDAPGDLELAEYSNWGFALFADAALTKQMGIFVEDADGGGWTITSEECPSIRASYGYEFRVAAEIDDYDEIFQIRDNFTETDDVYADMGVECSGWGLREAYYLVRYVDVDGSALDAPIVSRFSFTHELDTPAVVWSDDPDRPGDLMATWEPVDGATGYAIVKSRASTGIDGDVFSYRDYTIIGSAGEGQWRASEGFNADWLADEDDYAFIRQNADMLLAVNSDDSGVSDSDSTYAYEYGVIALRTDEETGARVSSAMAAEDALTLAQDRPFEFATFTWNEAYPTDKQGEERAGPDFSTIEDVPVTVPIAVLTGDLVDAPAVIDPATMTDAREVDGRDWYQAGLFAAGTQLGSPVNFPAESEEQALEFVAAFNTLSAQAAPDTGAARVERTIIDSEEEGSSEAPAVDYPIQPGSHPFVEFLAQHMVARTSSIDMSAWLDQPGLPDIGDAFLEAMAQNPYAYVDNGYWQGDTMWVEYAYEPEEYFAHQARLHDEVVAAVAAAVPEGASQAQAATAINDWIAGEVVYDDHALELMMAWSQDPQGMEWYEFKAANDLRYAWEANGVFENDAVVCASYSMAYTVMAWEAGLDARYVTGVVTESGVGHAWNKVSVDGQWWALDSTWNDGVGENVWMLISDSEFVDSAARTEDDFWILDGFQADYATP